MGKPAVFIRSDRVHDQAARFYHYRARKPIPPR